MAELKELYPFIILIITVGMIIGVGVLVLNSFADATYYTRTNYNDTFILSNYSTTALDYGNITVSKVWNGTYGTFPADCYDLNTTDGHFMFKNETTNCDILGDTGDNYIIYDFKEYATATKTATSAAANEIANIASDWIGLIVTVFILALILFLVIRSFGSAAGRN